MRDEWCSGEGSFFVRDVVEVGRARADAGIRVDVDGRVLVADAEVAPHGGVMGAGLAERKKNDSVLIGFEEVLSGFEEQMSRFPRRQKVPMESADHSNVYLTCMFPVA